eukprot:761082-Hanusia_phi.AAC.4
MSRDTNISHCQMSRHPSCSKDVRTAALFAVFEFNSWARSTTVQTLRDLRTFHLFILLFSVLITSSRLQPAFYFSACLHFFARLYLSSPSLDPYCVSLHILLSDISARSYPLLTKQTSLF